MASLDTVLNALRSARVDAADPILEHVVRVSDDGDTSERSITCMLLDGTVIRGDVGSDMTMAKACDAPLERLIDDRLALNDLPPESRKVLEEARPTLSGVSISSWLQSLYDARDETRTRSRNEETGASRGWTELPDDDLMLLAEFTSRNAITLVNATIEREGVKRQRSVPVLRVQFHSIASWWVGRDH